MNNTDDDMLQCGSCRCWFDEAHYTANGKDYKSCERCRNKASVRYNKMTGRGTGTKHSRGKRTNGPVPKKAKCLPNQIVTLQNTCYDIASNKEFEPLSYENTDTDSDADTLFDSDSDFEEQIEIPRKKPKKKILKTKPLKNMTIGDKIIELRDSVNEYGIAFINNGVFEQNGNIYDSTTGEFLIKNKDLTFYNDNKNSTLGHRMKRYK